jgi:hypothetical protein
MSGPSPAPYMSVRKILGNPLRPIGGTGQGVPESKTEALFPEQRRTTGDSNVPDGKPRSGLTRHRTQAGHMMTPSAHSPNNGFADIEHVFNSHAARRRRSG